MRSFVSRAFVLSSVCGFGALVLSGCAFDSTEPSSDVGESESAASVCSSLAGTYELTGCTVTGESNGSWTGGYQLPDAPSEATTSSPYYSPVREYKLLKGRSFTISQSVCASLGVNTDFPIYRSGLERGDCATYGDCAPGWDLPISFESKTKTYTPGTVKTPSKYSQSGYETKAITLDSAGLTVSYGYPGLAGPYAQRRSSDVDPYGVSDKAVFKKLANGDIEVNHTWGPAVTWRSSQFTLHTRPGSAKCTFKKK